MNGAAYDQRRQTTVARPPHDRITASPPPNDLRGVAITEFRIELVARDEFGSIVTLFTSHGAVDAATAAAEIANGTATYVTGPDSYVRAVVSPISSPVGPYLYVNWDGTRRNNLHDLSTGRRVPLPRRSAAAARAAARDAAPAAARDAAAQDATAAQGATAAQSAWMRILTSLTRPATVPRRRPILFAPLFLDLLRPHGITPRRSTKHH